MSFKLLGGGSSLDTIVNDVNQNILELKGREVTDLFKDDTGIYRVLLGKGANGFYGLKVSDEGHDVTTASDEHLIFNSSNPRLYVIGNGTISPNLVGLATAPGDYETATTTTTVPHNLGFEPTLILARTTDGFQIPYTRITEIATTGFMQHHMTISWDDTNIYFKDIAFGFNSGDDVDSFDIEYFIYSS